MDSIYSTDPVTQELLTAGVATVGISVRSITEKPPQPVLHQGVVATLKVELTNTGSAIPLQAGANPSTITIFLPRYVTPAEVQAMSIKLPSWTFAVSPGGASLTLTYAGPGPGTWVGAFTFEITNVVAAAKPTEGTFVVNFKNFTGLSMLTQPLPLQNAAQPGNPSLADVLGVSLDSRGTVYISSTLDPLSNRLFMNVKNTGATALYTGTGSPKGAVITVEFCYGSTSGAIGPATPASRNKKSLGSAWNIIGGIAEDQTKGWRVDPASGGDPAPIWRLTPLGSNTNLLGTGASSNVTFDFSDIVSITPVGHTQMIVSFTGFKKDDTTAYDDLTLTLDVVKEVAPPNRGLLNFFGTESPIVAVPSSSSPIDIPLRWAMADVNRIDLITNFPGLDFYSKTYAKPPKTPDALGYDHYTLRIPAASESQPVFATLQARNAEGAFLNSLQFTAYLQMLVFHDPRDNKDYPTELIGNKFWMTSNLDYDEVNSKLYNNYGPNAAKYGRLYGGMSESVLNPPDGWHIPSLSDWKELFDFYGGGKAAYTKLMETSKGSFAAQLGGRFAPSTIDPEFQDIAQVGYYHVSGDPTWASFSDSAKSVFLTGTIPPGAMFSIRYVKDV